MKHIKSLFCILLVAFLLSGCSFHLASSVNDLISPIAPFGDDALIKEALDKYVQSGYSLKNPSAGNNITSYSFCNLMDDKEKEAVVFYEPNNELGKIKMALLKYNEQKWKVVAEIRGEGEDIYQLDFADVNNDGKTEIISCWNTISNSTNHTFDIYTIEQNNSEYKIKKLVDESKTINNYYIVDINNDGKLELVLFQIKSGNYSTSKAELFTISNSKYNLIGETKLDSRISSYVNISAEQAEGYTRIYADALNSNGDSMLTEIIYWSDAYNSIISPFYSYATGVTSGTRRDCLVKATDINSDKKIEVPTDYNKIKVQKELKVIDWKVYKNTILMHKNYSIYVQDDNYNVLIPDKLIKKISVSYDKESKEFTLLDKESKSNVFSIKPILKVVYDNEPVEGYQIILENSGYYYLAKCEDNKNIKISYDELKQYIKTN